MSKVEGCLVVEPVWREEGLLLILIYARPLTLLHVEVTPTDQLAIEARLCDLRGCLALILC
jgi:hypothetical protein